MTTCDGFSMRESITSLPHPDSFAQNLSQELRAAVAAFEAEHRGHQPLAAVSKAFKRAASVLSLCAPLPGKREFVVGDRVILWRLQQRQDLNGCVAIVKSNADVIEGDGRVEVCVGAGKSKKEMLRVRPANLRLDWHVAADYHAAKLHGKVFVRSLDSVFRDQVCQVVSGDPATWEITIRALESDTAADSDRLELIPVAALVPAAYIDIAKDVHECAVTIALQAAGVSATPAVREVMNAVHSCADFNIRCGRGGDAARACVAVMDAMFKGGKSGSTPSSRLQDHYERLSWVSKFLAVCLDHVDIQLQARGWYDDACALLMLCKDVISSIQGSDCYNFFVLLNNLAALHTRQDRLDEAEAMYKEALRIRELNYHPLSAPSQQKGMHENYEVSIAATMHNLALVHIRQNRLADAEALYHEAQRRQELKLGHESLEVASTLQDLAALHEKQNRLDDAATMCKESMRIREMHLGHESIDVASSMSCLAAVLLKQRKYDDAEALFKEALRIQRLRLGDDSVDFSLSDTVNNLALLFADQNRFEEAESMQQQALFIQMLMYGEDSLNVALVRSKIAGLYLKLNRLEHAEEWFKEALRVKELELGHESIDVASDLCDLASVVCALERYAEGEALHREAMRIRQLKRGHDSLEVAASLAHLAALCAEQNRVEEAEAMYKKALRIREEKLGHADAAAAELRVRLVELQPPPLSDI